MSVYVVGDVVKVVKKVDISGLGWNSDMSAMIGRECKVKRVHSNPDTPAVYLEDRDGYTWAFPDASVELVASKYIDGVAVSNSEFALRTAVPVEMTLEQIERELGKKIKLI